MRSSFRGASPRMTVLPVLMLLLLIVLAALQYRWTGQLGIAERQQMRINVQSAVSRYATDFDRELTRALVYFLPTQPPEEAYAAAVLDRFDNWIAGAPHPELVDSVYLVQRVGEEVQLQRLDQQARSFESVAWDDAFESIKQTLTDPPSRRPHTGPPRNRHDRGRGFEFAPLFDDVPALIVPLSDRPFPGLGRGSRGSARPPAFVILKLDRDYITGELLPLLTERHFGDGDYEIVVTRAVDTEEPGDLAQPEPVIYRSDPDEAIDPEGRADATAPLFGILPGREFASLFASAGNSGRESEALRRRLAGNRLRRPPTPADGPRDGFKLWVLTATHRSGSLEAAIAAVRFRNLSISFGILVLLAGSVILILLSARRAQELARQKMEFVAGVSHELRTPLAVICSAGQNLADGVTDDPHRVRDYGKLIRDEGRRLSEMVAQVLEYASVQSGRKSYGQARIRIPDVVEAALADCKTMIDDEGFTIERSYADALPEVEGDSEALRRAVQNLIVNAVKYAGDTAWIGVRVESDQRQVAAANAALTITVEDRGRGIEPSEQARIFEPFFRGAVAVADQIHGNGLGLSLVRQIVEAHGGRVSVVSSTVGEKRGSAFTLHLPAAPAAPGSPATSGRREDEVDGEVGHPAHG